jgi:hypothetical protein
VIKFCIKLKGVNWLSSRSLNREVYGIAVRLLGVIDIWPMFILLHHSI